MPKAGHAEYMRRYRATVRPKREREAQKEGYRAGVKDCIDLMRVLFGERSLTGFAAAHAMEKTLGTLKFSELTSKT
jgi:hypothetical protein